MSMFSESEMKRMLVEASDLRAGHSPNGLPFSDTDMRGMLEEANLSEITSEPVDRSWSARYDRAHDKEESLFGKGAIIAASESPDGLENLVGGEDFDEKFKNVAEGALALVNPLNYLDQGITTPINMALNAVGVDYQFAKFASMTGQKTLSEGFATVVANTPMANDVLNDATRRIVADSPAAQQWEDSTPPERAQMITQAIREEHEQKYSHVERFADRGNYSGGSFMRQVKDPTLALPVGKGFQAGAAIGGAIGVTDAAARGYIKGEINPTEVIVTGLLTSLFGGTLGHFTGGGTELAKTVTSNVSRNIKVTADDVLQAMTNKTSASIVEEIMSFEQALKVAKEINTTFKISAKKALKTQVASATGILNGKSHLTAYQVIKDIDLTLLRFKEDLAPQDVKKLEISKEALKETQAAVKAIPDRLLTHPPRTATESKGLGPFSVKMDEMERNIINDMKVQQDQILHDYLEIIPRQISEEVKAARLEGRVIDSPRRADVKDEYVLGLSPNPITPYRNREELVLAARRGENSYASSTMTNSGDVIRHESMPDLGVHVPLLNKGEEIRGGFWHNSWRAVGLQHWGQDPTIYLDNMGVHGMRVAARIRRWEETTAVVLQEKVTRLTKAFRDVPKSSQSDLNVESYLRGYLPKSQLTEAEKSAANTVRAVQSDALKAARDEGVITQKEYLEFKANADIYLNRVYNHNYLDSRGGKAHFYEVLENHKFGNSQTAENIIAALSGRDRKISKVKKSDGTSEYRGYKQNDDGSFSLTKESIDYIYQMKGKTAGAGKPGSFKARKIPDELEEALQPFMVHNTQAVVEKYLDEVYTAVQYNKWFGKDGRHVGKDLLELQKLNNARGLEAREIYYTAVSSPESQVVKNALKDDSNHTYLNIMSGLESTNLILAQVANVPQATFNGLILTSRMSGSSVEALSAYTKGLQSLFTKEGREFAEATGAAYQGTMMQLLADMGGNSAKFTTAFLRGTGFLAIEKGQRLLGAAIGKAMIENISTNTAKLLTKKASNGLSRRQEKKLIRYQNQLAEMGINPNTAIDPKAAKPALAISQEEMLRGSQWFSNTVNFQASKAHKPLLSQSPWAKAFYMFKSYSLWQAGFIKKNIVEPIIREGDIKPLIVMGAIGYVGAPRDMLSKWISGDWEEYELVSAAGYLGAYMNAGGAGIAGDVVKEVFSGRSGGAGRMITGPIINDMWKFGEGAAKSAMASIDEGSLNLDDFGRAALKIAVPGAFATGAEEYLFDDRTPQYVQDLQNVAE